MHIKSFIVSALLVAPAWGITCLGPTTTRMDAGQLAISTRVSYSEVDYEDRDDNVTQYPDSLGRSALAGLHVGLDSQRAELYGLFGYGRLGDLKKRTSLGGGVRVTTNLDDPLSWGLVAQAVYFKAQDEYYRIRSELIEAQLAFGPCWRPRLSRHSDDTGILYGGPMLYWATGKDTLMDNGKTTLTNIRTTDWWGGYLGGGVSIFNGHLPLLIEGQITPSAWGCSGYIAVEF